MSSAAARKMMDMSVCPRTLLQYNNCWRKWEAYCQTSSLSPYTASPDNVMSYFLHRGLGLSGTYTILSAISHYCRREGNVSPCDDPRIRMYMRGLKRKQSLQPVKRAKPITLSILRRLVETLAHDDSLVTWRTVWRLFISFSCFLRWDDVCRLQVSDLTLRRNSQGWFYRIELRGGKTNQYNAPSFRVITANEGLLCPFKLTRRYLRRLGPNHRGSLQPSCAPNNRNLPHRSRQIAYTLALSNMRDLLTSLGYVGTDYGEHSARRGAATHSSEIGIPDSEIQLAGGWETARAMKLYIDRKPQQFQRISKKIFSQSE